MIDRSLNYGRHHIASFLKDVGSANRILDIGAGHGTDLGLAHKVFPEAELLAIESYPPYVEELSRGGYQSIHWI